VLGLIFIVVVLFAPKGIVGALQDLVARRRAARRRTTDKASDDETGTTEAPVPSSTPSGS